MTWLETGKQGEYAGGLSSRWEPRMCHLAQTSVPSERASVPRARRWVGGRLEQWGLPTDDLALVTSELVCNALPHARAEIRVTVSVGRSVVELSVSDDDLGSPPQVEHPGEDDTGGRGLMLVGELCDDWGTTPHAGGKRTWARVAAPQGSGYQSRCMCTADVTGAREEHRSASGQRIVRDNEQEERAGAS